MYLQKCTFYEFHGIAFLIFSIISKNCTTSLSLLIFPIKNAGLIPSDKESAIYPLSKKGGGNAVVIAVGGAPEALDAHPGTFNVLLAKKKGFIKMAMVHG